MPACGGSSEQTVYTHSLRMDFSPLLSFLLFIKACYQSRKQQELEHAGAQFTSGESASLPLVYLSFLSFSLFYLHLVPNCLKYWSLTHSCFVSLSFLLPLFEIILKSNTEQTHKRGLGELACSFSRCLFAVTSHYR